MKESSLMTWMRDNALGIYISIPFCRSKCTYCNFASGVYPASEQGRYVERVVSDMAEAAQRAAESGLELPRRVDTVYLGGGTPSLLEPGLIGRLFAELRARFEVEAGAEITMECAPGQLSEQGLAALVAAGVNRVSLGVQSFIDKEAHESGRLHGRAIVLTDLARLRAAGIRNVSLDLIAGLAGQTFASWDESLDVLVEAETPHASVYMLEVDEDSRLGRELLSGGARYRAGLVPTDDAITRMYERAVERMEAAGLRQYEISNFAREGFRSLHNLRYWKRRPYLGLGLDASSALRAEEAPDVVRWKTSDDLKRYLAGGGAIESDRLGLDQQLEEAWFLGLRLNAGVAFAQLEREFGEERVAPARSVVAGLVEQSLAEESGGLVRLTGRGRLLSNDVFERFLGPLPAR